MPPRVFGRGRSALPAPLVCVCMHRYVWARFSHTGGAFRPRSAHQRQRSDGDLGRRSGFQAVRGPQGLLPGFRRRPPRLPPLPPAARRCQCAGRPPLGPVRSRCTRCSALAHPAAALHTASAQDDYIQYFVTRPATRPPLINRGHYSRVASIRKMISQFLVASRLHGVSVCVCVRARTCMRVRVHV